MVHYITSIIEISSRCCILFSLQPGNIRPPQQPLTILAIDTEAAEGDPESGLLGTDFMFFTAFLGGLPLHSTKSNLPYNDNRPH